MDARSLGFLILAAVLEVGGDALVRWGLKGSKLGLPLGAAVLFAYGLSVNLPKWDFGRLMGVYIALFFIVAQATSVLVFKEKLGTPALVGGVFIVAGGAVMTFWKGAPAL